MAYSHLVLGSSPPFSSALAPIQLPMTSSLGDSPVPQTWGSPFTLGVFCYSNLSLFSVSGIFIKLLVQAGTSAVPRDRAAGPGAWPPYASSMGSGDKGGHGLLLPPRSPRCPRSTDAAGGQGQGLTSPDLGFAGAGALACPLRGWSWGSAGTSERRQWEDVRAQSSQASFLFWPI